MLSSSLGGYGEEKLFFSPASLSDSSDQEIDFWKLSIWKCFQWRENKI